MEQRHNSTTTTTLSPSNSMLVPYAHRHLAAAPPTASSSRLSIPVGWGVEEVPRPDGSRSDRYYYEPGSGKKFRSIREVHRYLNQERGLVPCRRSTRTSIYNQNYEYRRMLLSLDRNSDHQKMIVSGGKLFSVDDEVSQNHLAIVPSGTAAPFILPDGWIVEKVPRKYDNSSDKYYYEPGTGKKFRSLVAVEKHLAELEENAPLSKALEDIKENQPLSKVFKLENLTKNAEHRKMIVSGGKLFRVDDEVSQSHLAMVPFEKASTMEPFILPDGWIVEEVPRKYSNWSDKYYYEPGTGKKFRSLAAVEKHLAELQENSPLFKASKDIKENEPLSKVLKLETLTKKKVSQENTEASSFICPPMKVKWVIASPQGDVWNPFISEALVPDAVKQQWNNRFMLYMNDGTNNFQPSGA